MSFKKILTVLGFAAVTAACGSEQAPEQTSQTKSLVGYPCQEYGVNISDTRYHCIRMEGGIANDVLVELRGYNDSQRTKIKQALDITAQRFRDFWKVSQAPLLSCAKKYSTKDFDAKGGMGANFPELDRKIVWALTITQFGFKYHADTKQALIIDAFTTPSPNGTSFTMAHAVLGDDSVKLATASYDAANYNIGINTVALDQSFFGPEEFAGSIYHEWMHRSGWNHPNGYDGSFIKELGLCMTRNNADKSGFSLTNSYEMID